tara:strand:- start:30811 stop:32766 length:1956 start_codon:yes stop_codon:yes gene_type:complete
MTKICPQFHVLASVSGYKTVVKSRSLDAYDLNQLESMGFGQTDQESYLSSLDQFPAAIGRPLQSRRYAVTRCLRGAPDTAGRTTFKFVSLIFEHDDWVKTVSKCVTQLFQSLDIWHEVLTAPTNISVDFIMKSWPADQKLPVLSVMDAVVDADERTVVVLPDTRQCSNAILLLPSLLPPKERALMNWGLRVLSTGSNIEVCTLPEVADHSGRRKLFHFKNGVPLKTPYGNALSHFWNSNSEPPFQFIDQSSSTRQFFPSKQNIEISQEALRASSKFQWRGNRNLIIALISVAAIIPIGYCAVGFFGQKPNDENANQDQSSQAVVEDSEIASIDLNPTSSPNSFTPNEMAAMNLVETFALSNKWSVQEISEWVVEARSLFHVDQVDGYKESVQKARGVLDWRDESKSQNIQILQKWESTKIDTKDVDLDPAEIKDMLDNLRQDLATVNRLKNDPRQVSFDGVDKSDFDELINLINEQIELADEILLEAESLIVEEAIQELPLDDEVITPTQSPESSSEQQEELLRVIVEVQEFAKLLKIKHDIPYEKSPSVQRLEEWWALLDNDAVPDLATVYRKNRRLARQWAVKAIRWRFEALKIQKESVESDSDKEIIHSTIIKLSDLHLSIRPDRDQSSDLREEMFEYLKPPKDEEDD